MYVKCTTVTAKYFRSKKSNTQTKKKNPEYDNFDGMGFTDMSGKKSVSFRHC